MHGLFAEFKNFDKNLAHMISRADTRHRLSSKLTRKTAYRLCPRLDLRANPRQPACAVARLGINTDFSEDRMLETTIEVEAAMLLQKKCSPLLYATKYVNEQTPFPGCSKYLLC
jgi:hypothetical protein